jgi:nucleolar protein 56
MRREQRHGRREGGRRENRGGPQVAYSAEPVITKLTPFGVFVYHGAEVLKKMFWGKNPVICADKYIKADVEIKALNNSIPLKAKRITEGIYGEQLAEFAAANGFRDVDEFNEFFQQFNVELTKLKIKYGFKRDKLVIQSVHNLEELNKMLNIMYERLREWYGFYYPESIKKVDSLEKFAEMAGKARHESSMGYDLEAEDLAIIKKAGDEMCSMINYRNCLNYYLEDTMTAIAPNLTNVAGVVVGAKLIAAAGSMERLAKMTSSTVQLLGAERALFRHLRSGAKPPKYGYILQHSMMSQIPPQNRGKLSRTLSGKITIAAKVDYNSEGREQVWEQLNADLNKRVKELS